MTDLDVVNKAAGILRIGLKSVGVYSYPDPNENDEDEMLVSVLWGYAKMSGNPMMNLIDDDLEVSWTNN